VSESDVQRWEGTEPGALQARRGRHARQVQLELGSAQRWRSFACLREGAAPGNRLPREKYKGDDGTTWTARSCWLTEDSRRKIVDGMIETMVAEIQKPPPAKKRMAGGRGLVDPVQGRGVRDALPQPSLVSDPKAKSSSSPAEPVGADRLREPDREQRASTGREIMRSSARESVRSLPGLINETSRRSTVARSSRISATRTKQKGIEALVALANGSTAGLVERRSGRRRLRAKSGAKSRRRAYSRSSSTRIKSSRRSSAR